MAPERHTACDEFHSSQAGTREAQEIYTFLTLIYVNYINLYNFPITDVDRLSDEAARDALCLTVEREGVTFSLGDTAFTVPLFDDFMKRVIPELH